METPLNIYRNGNALNKELERLTKAKISQRNKEAIIRYGKYQLANNVGIPRVARISMGIRTLALSLEKDFEAATKEDIEVLVSKINQNADYSPATISDFKQIIKQFYKFLKGNREEYPQEVKWIKTAIKLNHRKQFEELIHPEEIRNVLYCCENIRDKAFLSLLFESGARIAEILNMKIKDFNRFDRFAKVRFFGKTGERWVTIVSSIDPINKYMEKHPFKADVNSYLWLSEGSYRHLQPLLYTGAVKLIKRAFRTAGQKKRCNPHLFRHSRATELAPALTEVQMSLYLGWVLGTKQIRNYVHASGKEVDGAILKLHGLTEKSVEEQTIRIQCHRCGVMNIGSNFCKECGLALDVPSAIKLDDQVKQETDKAFDLLMEMSQNPALLKEFEEFKRNSLTVRENLQKKAAKA